MENIKNILSSFDNNSAAQLKYYLITCLFPEQNDALIKEIGDFNPKTYGIIKNKVIEKDLPLLKFDNSNNSEGFGPELQHQRKALDEAAEENQNLTKEVEAYSAKVAQLQAELDKFRDEWEKDFFKRADTETTLRNEIAKLTKERDDWKATAKIYKQEAEDYKKKLSAGRERNPLLEGA